MRKELAEYSDFALHSFAAAHGKAFAKYLLPKERVRESAKCRFLARLLPELKVRPSCNVSAASGGRQRDCLLNITAQQLAIIRK